MCFLESGYFKGVFLEPQKQWTGLAEGKDKPFTKQLYAWVMTTYYDLPS